MSCCGNKRKTWLNESRQSTTTEKTLATKDTIDRKSRIFEYGGTRSKRFIGAVSGQTYFFRFSGHRIGVAYEDSFGLMGEGDLKVLKN